MKLSLATVLLALTAGVASTSWAQSSPTTPRASPSLRTTLQVGTATWDHVAVGQLVLTTAHGTEGLDREVRGVEPLAISRWMPRMRDTVVAVGYGTADWRCGESLRNPDDGSANEDAPCAETEVKREDTFLWADRAACGVLEPGDSGGPILWNGTVVAVATGLQRSDDEQQDIWAETWSFTQEFRGAVAEWYGDDGELFIDGDDDADDESDDSDHDEGATTSAPTQRGLMCRARQR